MVMNTMTERKCELESGRRERENEDEEEEEEERERERERERCMNERDDKRS